MKSRFDTWPFEVIENLAKNYGSHAVDVIALAEQDLSLADTLHDALPDIAAEVIHAVRHEMALTLNDVLFRRTGIGTLGHPGDATIAAIASIIAKELSWSADETQRQIDSVAPRFRVKSASGQIS